MSYISVAGLHSRDGGFGAVSSADLAFRVAGLKSRAKAAADKIVDSMFFSGGAKQWRDTVFLPQVNQLVDAASKKRVDGRFGFEVDPSVVQRIVSFIEAEVNQAKKEYGVSASVNSFLQDQVQMAKSVLNSATEYLAAPSTDAKLSQLEQTNRRQAQASADLARSADALTKAAPPPSRRAAPATPAAPAASEAPAFTPSAEPPVLPPDDKDKNKFPVVPVAAGVAAVAILFLLLGDERAPRRFP